MDGSFEMIPYMKPTIALKTAHLTLYHRIYQCFDRFTIIRNNQGQTYTENSLPSSQPFTQSSRYCHSYFPCLSQLYLVADAKQRENNWQYCEDCANVRAQDRECFVYVRPCHFLYSEMTKTLTFPVHYTTASLSSNKERLRNKQQYLQNEMIGRWGRCELQIITDRSTSFINNSPS